MGEWWDRLSDASRVGRPMLAPIVECLAARISGNRLEQMQQSSATWANGLNAAHKLLGLDALMIGFDPSLAADATPAEAGAGQGRWQTMLGALEQLVKSPTDGPGVVAMLPGPAQLAACLGGVDPASLKAGLIRLAEACCQRSPDLLLMFEGDVLGCEGLEAAQQRVYQTLKRVAAYYDVPLGLHLCGQAPGSGADLARLRLALCLLGPDSRGRPAAAADCTALADAGTRIGMALPFDTSDQIVKALRSSSDVALVTSETQVADDVDLQKFTKMLDEVRTELGTRGHGRAQSGPGDRETFGT